MSANIAYAYATYNGQSGDHTGGHVGARHRRYLHELVIEQLICHDFVGEDDDGGGGGGVVDRFQTAQLQVNAVSALCFCWFCCDSSRLVVKMMIIYVICSTHKYSNTTNMYILVVVVVVVVAVAAMVGEEGEDEANSAHTRNSNVALIMRT